MGFYIMAIPPILVALSVSPSTALWVTIFMLALDEVMGDFVFPKLRSNTMNIHPVSILFILIAMTSAFGITGALLATPLTAIIKAFYEEFAGTDSKDEAIENSIDTIIYKNKKPVPKKK
jgi:putative permease